MGRGTQRLSRFKGGWGEAGPGRARRGLSRGLGLRLGPGPAGAGAVRAGTCPVLTAACLAEQMKMMVATYRISSGTVRKHVGKPAGDRGPGVATPALVRTGR